MARRVSGLRSSLLATMNRARGFLDHPLVIAFLFALVSLSQQLQAEDVAASLPGVVKAVWDVTRAYHQTTPTRERICLNGLWRWQPADARS